MTEDEWLSRIENDLEDLWEYQNYVPGAEFNIGKLCSMATDLCHTIAPLIAKVRALRKIKDAAKPTIGLMCKNARYAHDGCFACGLAKAIEAYERGENCSP